MAIEVVIGHESGEGEKSYYQLATANGLEQLGEWESNLPDGYAPNFGHLINFGWVGGLDDLCDQIRDALDDYPPATNVRSIAEHLAHLVDHRDEDDIVVIVSN